MQSSKWVTLMFGALCLVLVAAAVNAQHLYYMAAILLVLPGVSYALGWFALRGLEFRRELPATAWQGEQGEIVYVVHNRSQVSRYFLSVHASLPPWIEPLEPEAPLFNVGAGETTRIPVAVRFERRGVYRVKGFEATAMDPLGVFAFTRKIPCEGELVVYPTPEPMRTMSMTGEGRYGWQEMMTTLNRGHGVDFHGVREYTPGDSLRRIHWRQTARTGKMSVIEFEEPEAVSVAIVLDLQRGTEVGEGKETTLEYSVRFAASLAYLAITQGASVQLITSTDASRDPTTESVLRAAALPGRGQTHLFTLLDALARVQAESLLPAAELALQALHAVPRGTTVVVLTARADHRLAETLGQYTLNGASVVAVYVDPDSFNDRSTPARHHSPAEFLTALLAAGVHPFLLSRHPEGQLIPEAVQDVHYAIPQPVAS
ncbi:MAG: DUF58 domain-containing protein [Chloroherpetonaceae bacterium]|nr:DUF58 domain-containing protein [Chthonomonadaceae bacterium]MDW8207291.1 DUF58 domain-containing protein [Chloroherpetonaceae bacterium]